MIKRIRIFSEGNIKNVRPNCFDDSDENPKLVVADRASKRLQWFGMDGKHIRKQDGFLLPAGIDVQGDLMLMPDLHAHVTLLNLQN